MEPDLEEIMSGDRTQVGATKRRTTGGAGANYEWGQDPGRSYKAKNHRGGNPGMLRGDPVRDPALARFYPVLEATRRDRKLVSRLLRQRAVTPSGHILDPFFNHY